jgi:FHA domain-containing protein
MSVESDGDLPEFLELARFAKDARSLDGDAFRARHGEHFLVRRGALSPERRPKRPQQTLAIKDVKDLAAAVAAAAAGPPATPELVVFPVRATGRSPFPRMITVGRTKNNDVVLSDIGVSKFHAYFKEEGGKLTLQDAESRNGTFANGETVATNKLGKPAVVLPGTKVKFGMLEFWLIDAAGLQDVARRTFP